ncbi:MAG: DUF262 domain-containing HNH endonuclease family protein [Bacteroidales bacterium]|nr:DUF262 domain-containing HNH endonuclease family protein [Bacteroidales bacterium]
MENGQKTIFQLFSGEKHFIIPKYQRAYSWDEKQLQDFLEDTQNQRIDKDYFFGTILFQDRGMKDGFEHIEIVDGQQRITTLIIFMKVLLKALSSKDNNSKYSREIKRYIKDDNFYKLELIQLDNDFFKTYIIDDNPFNEKFFSTPSQKRLYFAKDYFEKQLNNTELNLLEEYKQKVEKTKLLTYSVTDTAEATLIFETTNDRGKALTNLEKTKSFLMHKVYLTKEKPLELLNSIHDRFSEIYRILEEIENNIDEDSVLQYHFIAHLNWGYSKKSKDYQKYVPKLKEKINKMMKSDNPEKAANFIDQYSRKLLETFRVVKEILNDENPHLRDLFILGRLSYFYPLMIKCYKYDKTKNKSNFYKTIKLLEIFSFKVYGIGSKPSNTGETKLYTIAKDFKGDFFELQNQLKRVIEEYISNKKFKSLLSSSNFYYDYYNPEIIYLFWKYENYLRTTEQPIAAEMSEKEFLSPNSRFKLTIEHIASQNPKVCTSKLELPEIDEEFEEEFLHCIGNLAFDPNSANASKGNNDIDIKNSKYFIKAPFKIQNELNDFIVNKKWTENSIKRRSDKIIEFAIDYWNPANIN